MEFIDPTKAEFLKLIDEAKNKLIDPVVMLKWVWLRVLILEIPDEEFQKYMERVSNTLEK